MPVVRWLHKIWNTFWAIVVVVFTIVVIGAGVIFGVAQLDSSKTFLATQIEKNFSKKYNGVLTIGKLDGLIPFSIELQDVNLYPDSSSVQSVFHSDSISTNLDFFALLGQRFVVTGLSINTPRIMIDQESKNSLLHALKKKSTISSQDSAGIDAPFFEILAPNAIVTNGTVVIKNAFEGSKLTPYSDSITVRDIDVSMYFEYHKNERLLDIENLSFFTKEIDSGRTKINGQIYSNDRFLEFNSFNVVNENSYLNITGRLDGIDIYKPNLLEQLKEAEYNLDLRELSISDARMNDLVFDSVFFKKPLFLSSEISGRLNNLELNTANIRYGNSEISFSGLIANAFSEDSLTYEAAISEIIVDTSDVKDFALDITQYQLNAIPDISITADLSGNVRSIKGRLAGMGNRGKITFDGAIGFGDQKNMNVAYQTDSLDIGNLFGKVIQSSKITSSGELITSDYTSPSSFKWFSFESTGFEINDSTFNKVKIDAIGEAGVLRPNFLVNAKGGTLQGKGIIDMSSPNNTSIKFDGTGQKLDTKYLSQLNELAEVIADIEYTVDLQGGSFDDISGTVSIDVPLATVGEDTLRPHLLYADIANTAGNDKSLRITTTVADITLEGDYQLTNLRALFNHWKSYFQKRVKSELFASSLTPASSHSETQLINQNFEFTGHIKDVGLVKKYYPEFPDIQTSSRITSNITSDSLRLLFNADITDTKFRFKEYEADTLRTQITGSFRYDSELKDFSNFLVQSHAERLKTPFFNTQGLIVDLGLDKDSIFIETNINAIGEEASLKLVSDGALTDSSVVLNLNDFFLGSEAYAWKNRDSLKLIYTDEKRLILDTFAFENNEELFIAEGTFSNDVEDSVSYNFRGVRLDRISDLINGEIGFGGNLNGAFTTRTLTRIPTIVGELSLEALSLNSQIVGDFNISSVFNQALNRFDTNVSVYTDSTIYPNYFLRNDRQGQDFDFNGYVLAPVAGEFPDVDSLFYFDLDFNAIDLWVIPFLAPKVFTEMSGTATGSGQIWGNLETYDFLVDYEIGTEDAVYIKPRFIDTYYYGQGPVTFTRSDGLVFEDIFLIDPSGGMAVLNGWYNFNDFDLVNSMNIQLEMDEFKFLNNEFDPTAPFFGEAYGTGIIGITGTNVAPVLSTIEPINISDFSRVELPLLEETDLDEDNKFIRFVDSFDEFDADSGSGSDNTTFTIDEELDLSQLTFKERFTLDLQFVADNPMEVRLIFDQVTGDIVSTNGTGRLRIRLEDEDVSIFGRLDISGGDYQFVSGDIFTRRFILEPNGSIIWEGEPDNARVNIDAVYSARPNIRTLTTSRAELDLDDPESVQRAPVDLVLNISGSLSSVENDFYFRLPDNFESRQNSTLSTQITSLNRNEEEKLLQATSFLLMGDFIPASSVNGASSLTQNFSGSSAVLNPLLSNQVISPLLSNQINSLLRSDITSFDVDFNLNTYNQVDLGLALRLYNDRIILRRDGQITGAQSNIGDIGATYKINRIFSVTAFHRQDPTFSNLSSGQESQQAQDINGVGVEAQVSFNTWQDFFRRLGSPFRKLFGTNKKEEENKEDENPS